ncbi:MAG: hypothetical protein J2P15_09490, partial [Micromonosporaceae bacterium]|nr:hypothetical protein [Micromonosporaceae bacterium]
MASSDQAALPRHAGAPDAALPGATEPGATEPGAALPGHALLLLAALAATAVAQGGYYPAGRIVALTLTIVAAVLAGRAGHRAGTGIWPVPVVYLVVACAGLALWTVADGLLHPGPAGGAGGGVPLLAGLGCLAAAATVVRHTGSAQIGTAQGGTAQSGSVDGGPGPRELFADAVVALGPLVAVPGWIGVAWHRPPWASVVEGLWRAGSTLTYANAAAALLAALCLLALARVIDRPGSLVRAGMAYLSLVGLAATMSRAGLVAFGVGLIPLVLLAGARGRWLVALQILPLLLGAAVALAGLAPSVPASAPARPLPAPI